MTTKAEWERRQSAFLERIGEASLADLERGTIVVLPSASFPVEELTKITGIQHYEERMLFTMLFLANPETRIVYLTSLPVDEAVIEYYLRFVPDPDAARRRLLFHSLGDPSPVCLTEKLLARPEAVAAMRGLVEDPDDAYVLPFNITNGEWALAEALGLPLYGGHSDLAELGSKTGSRRVARQAGVAVLEGREGLYTIEELESAVRAIQARRPAAEAVVAKLNDGFSGQGNAIIELAGPVPPFPLDSSATTFCAAGESWPAFSAKMAQRGAVVEELVRHKTMVSPSVQLRVAPGGTVEVLSTHDQILGGPDNQVYLGCRFPADESYRLAIQEAGTKVSALLAAEGVLGSFGVDFVVMPSAGGAAGHEIYLSEINLRMGGTSHPFWMARLATGGVYDPATGQLRVEDGVRTYVASDNLKSQRLVGKTPADVIEAVDKAGLAFDPISRTGATLHLLGALRGFGKMGLTCVAESLDEADELYREVVATVS
ncbi:MAG TPA: peptide ligase PGM1-related protein [Acidimicrobiales bacterium]|nr:peptide ligase PGM1-related protein [Acidimicrobiales bacterium]